MIGAFRRPDGRWQQAGTGVRWRPSSAPPWYRRTAGRMRLEAGPTTDLPRDPGPAPTVRAAALGAGLLIAQQGAAKGVRDAFYLSQFPVTTLPLALGASAGLSFCAVAGSPPPIARRP